MDLLVCPGLPDQNTNFDWFWACFLASSPSKYLVAKMCRSMTNALWDSSLFYQDEILSKQVMLSEHTMYRKKINGCTV